MANIAAPRPETETIGFGKRWAHILPSVFIVYTISYLDRVNIGTALPAISKEFGLNPTEAGFVGGVFFWGYLVSFLMGGWLSNRFGAKRVTLASLVAWSLAAMATGFTTSLASLLVMRALLGLAEGPIWSSMSAILAQWFVKPERARAFATWNASLPVGALLSGPISGLIISHYSWQTMLVVEGLPALIYALVWSRFIPDTPDEAAWLEPAERAALADGLAREQAQFDASLGPVDLRGVLLHPGVWLLLVAKTFNNMIAYGFTLWLPTAIKDASALGIGSVGVLTALPYAASVLGIWLIGLSSDRFNERRLHGAIPMLLLAALLYASSRTGAGSVAAMMVCVTLSGFFMFMTLPLMTVMFTQLLPRRQAIVAIAFSGAVANLVGGFFGPVVVGWLKTMTGDVSAGFTFLAAIGLIGGLLMMMVRTPEHAPGAVAPAPPAGIGGAPSVGRE
ncbi:MFS transporter [Methylobacterium mesophilicum]|nr:MFS transporter [Methylobacterium mesophilicum]